MSCRNCLLALFIACTGASCSGPRQYLSGSAPVLSYSRTMCFGPCPAFELEVDGNGTARFNGRAHIQPEGRHVGRFSEADLLALARTAHELRLDQLAGTYDNPMVMDLPSTRLNFGGHAVLDRINGPDLTALYSQLDSLIRQTTWTPAEGGK